MNTKGMKFLAVLAVLAMAFAAFAVVAPAETDDAATAEVTVKTATETGLASGNYYVATSNISLSVADADGNYNFYIAKGVSGLSLLTNNGANTHAPVFYMYVADSIDGTTVTYTAGNYISIAATDADDNADGITSIAINSSTGAFTFTSALAGALTKGAQIAEVHINSATPTYYTSADMAGKTFTFTGNGTNSVILMTGYTMSGSVTIKDSYEAAVNQVVLTDVTVAGTGPFTFNTADAATDALQCSSGHATGDSFSTGSMTVTNKITQDNTNPILFTGTAQLNAYADKANGTEAVLTSAPGAIAANDEPYIYGSVAPSASAYSYAENTSTVVYHFSNATVSGLSLTVTETAADPDVVKSFTLTLNGFTGTFTKQGIISSGCTGNITLSSGTFTLADSGAEEYTYTVGNGTTPTTITIGKGATVSCASNHADIISITDYASVVLYGTLNAYTGQTLEITSTHDGTNDGKFAAYSGAVLGQRVYITMNAADVSVGSAMKDIELTTELTSDQVYNQIQNVVITKDLVIRPGVTMVILGELTVNPGVTLTVSDTANLILGSLTAAADNFPSYMATADVQGTIEMKKGSTGVFNNGNGYNFTGSMDLDGALTINAKTVFKSGSEFNVTDDGTFVLEANNLLYINKGASMELEGKWDPTGGYAINVSGSMKIDGTITDVAANAVIKLQADDASVDIQNVKFMNADTNLVVSDSGTKFYKADGVTPVTVETGNVLTVNPGAASEFSGLKVVQDSYIYEDLVFSTLDMAGSLSNSTATAIALTIATTSQVDFYGGFTVKDELTVGEYVTFANSTNGTIFTISGDMYSAYSASTVTLNALTATGGIPATTVTGLLDVASNANIAKINAAFYDKTISGVKHYIYTSLETALETEDAFKVLGTITVTESTAIDAPKKVDASAANIIIGTTDDRNVVLTVKDGAKLTLGTATVNGSLVYEDYATGKKIGTIVSDVFVTSGNAQTFTNIYTAVAGASEGDVVTITKDEGAVVLDKSLTIPAGVSVEVPAGYSLYMNDGVILTINGELMAWDAIQHAAATKFVQKTILELTGEVKMVVNGAFMSVADVNYNTGANQYNAPGAYYNYTTSEAVFKCISPLSVAALLTNTSGMGPITLNGVLSVGDVSLGGTSYATTVALGADAEITAGTLTVANTTVNASNGVSFTGTIASEEGAVKLSYAKAFTVQNKAVSGEYQMQLLGTAIQDVSGKTTNTPVTISAGEVFVKGAVSVAKITISSGAILNVNKDNSLTNDSTTTVAGTLFVVDGGRFTNSSATSGVTVTGSLIVSEANPTEGTAAGVASIKELAIGQKRGDFTSASGSVIAAEIGDLVTVYVLAGCSISEAVVENMIASTFVVEGKEYATVYVQSGSGKLVKSIKCPALENAVFDTWTYVSSGKVNSITDTTTLATARTYTAAIDYTIYAIQIYTDAGIKAVSIDGIEMFNDQTNKFTTLSNIKAGTHTVSYTLKNGYEGTAQLYTADGTILKDLKFVTSGTDDIKDGKVTVVLQLNGTEQIIAPEPSPVEQNEWTITTILLLILVILIAVMAVIVALRLNRS
ncbi:MAG: hypothetical protein IKP04_02250 [Candidatus Methanomethylophilaceae archaeon]|nr:hypothetical protein [Candidatus Methanomethylophilaceae archaeon]